MKRIIWFIIGLLLLSSLVIFITLPKYNIYFNKYIINHISQIVYWLFFTIIISIVFLIIKENSNPVKTLAWIQILIFLPVIGFILYIFLGINHRKRKLFRNKLIQDYLTNEHFYKSKLSDSTDIKEEIFKIDSIRQLVRLLYENGKAMLSHNNQIEFIYSGDQKINRLYQDIQNARKSIHLEYFSILNDNTGRYLRDLLNEKLIEGVEVRVIYDAVGSWRTGKRFWRKLIRNGGECYAFSPVVLPFLSSKLNYRDHRKIAVIDNCISYIGGVNIGNQYMGLSKKFSYWRDTHLRIRGEASNLIQRMFLLDWMFVSNKNVFNEKYFSESKIKEGVPVQIISSGPDSDWENIHQAYFAMISSAKHYIYISTPYMLLDDSILMALKIAGLSGVDVRIMLPKVSDHKFVHYASRSYYYELIQAKVGIYEYHKGFMHAKMIIVDDEFCSVGSANLDIRSFSQNFEINALIFDKSKTIELKNQFLEDLTNCIEIQYDRFTKRPVLKRFIESVARLFSPVM